MRLRIVSWEDIFPIEKPQSHSGDTHTRAVPQIWVSMILMSSRSPCSARAFAWWQGQMLDCRHITPVGLTAALCTLKGHTITRHLNPCLTSQDRNIFSMKQILTAFSSSSTTRQPISLYFCGDRSPYGRGLPHRSDLQQVLPHVEASESLICYGAGRLNDHHNLSNGWRVGAAPALGLGLTSTTTLVFPGNIYAHLNPDHDSTIDECTGYGKVKGVSVCILTSHPVELEFNLTLYAGVN